MKTLPKTLLAIFFTGVSALGYGQKVDSLNTRSDASLRGLFAVSENICWVSGNNGTVLRTIDAGESFTKVSPEGVEALDFRDIHAFGKDTALVLSAGLPAVILKTVDGGQSWKETYRNEKEGVFFDGMDFWDCKNGLAFSDAPHRKILVIKTKDQGETWQTIDTASMPVVAKNQGGFAASGTSICTYGKQKAAIGLGGASAVILLTTDGGKSWNTIKTPIQSGNPEEGVFSIDFFNARIGMAVGGNYKGDSLSSRSAARTLNGGLSWHAINDTGITSTYRSCVKYVSNTAIVATSRTGISYTKDAGVTWQKMNGNFYTVSVGKDGSTWLSGNNGRVGKLTL